VARLAFFGTPALAVPPLEALGDAGHEIVLVVTRPDARRGRGTATTPSPVKEAARARGWRVATDLAALAEVGAELGVVVAYGRLIPPWALAAVPMVNLHFSLLPRWRGAAPVERALLSGDPVTGVCVMAVEEGLDTGAVYARQEVAIGADDDLETLRHRLVDVGTGLLLGCVAGGVSGLPEPVAQSGPPTYAEKIRPDELVLDWSQPAAVLDRVVRLGRAHTTFRGARLRVRRARLEPGAAPAGGDPPGTLLGTAVVTGEGLLGLVSVQPEGRGEMSAEDWRRGARPTAGERLGR
jgi:methionyl-tRNA formyltransferase